MKKFLSVLFTVVFCMSGALGLTASADGETKPVFADGLNDGTYNIEVQSSASMFKIVECELTVADGKMTALMTMSGKGYGKLYLGTGDQALSASESDFIGFTEAENGNHRFEIPVEALDKEIDCAAWSIRKEEWYDRKIVFKSETLPKEALKSDFFSVIIVTSAAAAAVIGAAVTVLICVKRKKRGGK